MQEKMLFSFIVRHLIHRVAQRRVKWCSVHLKRLHCYSRVKPELTV